MIFVPALASSAAQPVGDFLQRQIHHRLTLNKSSPQLMSAIAAKFDLAFHALPYPTLREPLRGTGTLPGKEIALLPPTLMRLIKASNLSITFIII
ncbi:MULTISPECIES: hypothetical protein [unclassified Microcoleus]|uniref:hypothetical protein n=1 Tax=unclassified Microcoleus TaxID=2642155 RepID=UPI002FD3E58E